MNRDEVTARLVVDRLAAALTARQDPARAPAMAAYMRNQFAFLGVPAPAQKEAFRVATGDLPRALPEDVVAAAATELWRREEREHQYVACQLVNRHARRNATAGFLATVERLLTTKPWWDTVDSLATHAVGDVVKRSPELRPTMDRWSRSEDLWLARAALLHMNRWRATTDQAWLFNACLQLAGHPDFFIRKAIGWALRELSKTDAAAVEDFVDRNRAQLSGLSRREALLWLDRQRRSIDPTSAFPK